MNSFSDTMKKAIALAIHTDTDFFVEDGLAYEGNRDDAFADYEHWANEKGVDCRFSSWLESEGIPLPDYDENDYNNDYLVLTDAEADQKCEDAIRELLWAFNPSFLAEVTGFDISIFEAIQANEKCESNNDAILQLVGDKFDDLVSDAIGADGRGHFLAGYDGHENEVNLHDYTGQNEYFFVYRNN